MIGLLFLGILAAWAWIALTLGKKIPKWLGITRYSKALGVVFSLLVFVAPVADEIIGKYQFNRLCEEYAKVRTTIPNQSYKTLRPVASASFKITDAVKPTSVDVISFGEHAKAEVVRSVTSVNQIDGWLLRWLGLAATSSCGTWNMFELPLDEQEAIRHFQFPERQITEITQSELPDSLNNFYPQSKEQINGQ